MKTAPYQEDPTENVKALMAASLVSIAQLREADKEYSKASEAHLREIIDIKAVYDAKLLAAEEKRSDANRVSDSKLVEVLSDRIRQLEKYQNRGEGKSGVTTPLMVAISGFFGALVLYIFQMVTR